ncbi:DUF4105 domain-containing protein [uncultured Treponema sp.]|uniref:lipoprotein N-acyltransferase Lnb domain-containing protein n=1 Tax=uncultured Treponema sp. TaxID=162155 RepID=UPI0025F91585|nr:DUF4105 domain-containing protein [uncultured Treponema sp.]
MFFTSKKASSIQRFFLTVFFLLIPQISLHAYKFPEKLSDKASISILAINYTDLAHSLFSKNCLRIYDKETEFDQVIDFEHFDNFDDTFFVLKFILKEKKAKIISKPFLTFYLEYAQKSNTSLTELILQLSPNEVAYIYSFLRTVHNALPDYEYDFDILANNSETHISQILHDCYRMVGKDTTERYSFSEIWEHKIRLHHIEDSYIMMSDKRTMDFNEREQANFFEKEKLSLLIVLTIITGIVFLTTLYQVLVYFFDKLYVISIYKTVQIFDFLILFITGFSGLVIVFLDVFSEQTLFRNNLQFLFLFPLHLLAAFRIFKPVKRRRLQISYWSLVSFFAFIYMLILSITVHEIPLIHLFFTLPIFFRTLYFDFLAIDVKNIKKAPAKTDA